MLERVLSDRDDLMKTARREARAHWRPHFAIWWGRGNPQVYDSVRNFYPMRDVAVPATWLLARLDGGSNIAGRLHQADPRPRILSTPHWIERVAAGVLHCPLSWLTATERAVVTERAGLISELRWEREGGKPRPDAGGRHLRGARWNRVRSIHFEALRRAYVRRTCVSLAVFPNETGNRDRSTETAEGGTRATAVLEGGADATTGKDTSLCAGPRCARYAWLARVAL
jgi:hypothetical protein